MRKTLLVLIATITILFGFTSCTEAERANMNISKQADYFGTVRRITVYNTLKDSVYMEAEGLLSISNNSTNELVVTCKVGPDRYKKNYIYLNEFVTYVVEDITGTVTDPYHYKWYIDTHVLPSIEIK